MGTDQRKKYLFYALGEILLVMVGILLALQVNNWNEYRKELKHEKEFLIALRSELQADLDDVYDSEVYQQLSKQSTNIIIDHLVNKIPYHDSLAYHFSLSTYIWFATPTGSVFESIKSRDLNLISNTDLRDTMVMTYGRIIPWQMDQSERFSQHMTHAVHSIFNSRFEDVWNTDYLDLADSKMVPINYDALCTDQEYLYFIKSLPNFQYYYIDIPTETLKLLFTRMIEMINEELGNM